VLDDLVCLSVDYIQPCSSAFVADIEAAPVGSGPRGAMVHLSMPVMVPTTLLVAGINNGDIIPGAVGLDDSYRGPLSRAERPQRIPKRWPSGRALMWVKVIGFLTTASASKG